MEKSNETLLIDYATGHVTHDDFVATLTETPQLWVSIQLLMDSVLSEHKDEFYNYIHCKLILETNNYKVKQTVEAFGLDTLYSRGVLHDIVSSIVEVLYPQIVRKYPPEISNTDVLDIIGLSCCGGTEADKVVDNILFNIPEGLSKAQYKKEAKRLIKEVFGISGRTPKWVQEPEWPIENGTPLRFVRQKKTGELTTYEFAYVDGTVLVIEQYS